MNLVRRIKEMEFFTLDETQCKLKRADWLQHVCWLPAVDDAVKRQNHHLSSIEENPIDSLLLSAFEFVDVNENGASSHVRGSEGRPRAKDACENGTVNSSSSHDFSNMDEQLAVGNETSMPGPPDGGSNPQLTANWQEPKS